MLIVLLVTVLLSQPSTLPGQRYLPTIRVNQYRWPQTGFSVMGTFRDKMPVFYTADGSGPPMWFGDWWDGCRMYIENGQVYGQGLYHASYVPMIWGEWDPLLLECNDGRPVLVGNEPELATQGDLTPTEMATLLRTVVTSGWSGPIWCCGVMVQHTAYMRAVVSEYRRLYGAWPLAVGIHAHLYVTGPDGSPVITSVSDADVIRAMSAFDEFIALLATNGLLGRRVVVSECCVLSNVLSQAEVWGAAERLVNHAMSNQNVATVAWFSIFSAGAPAGSEFRASDLVTGSQVNALGRAWTDYAASGRVLRGD